MNLSNFDRFSKSQFFLGHAVLIGIILFICKSNHSYNYLLELIFKNKGNDENGTGTYFSCFFVFLLEKP